MLKIKYKKDMIIKFFMLIPFCMIALVMYQGALKETGIYSVLFFASILLILFQFYTIITVAIKNQELIMDITKDELNFKIIQQNRVLLEQNIKRADIKDIETHIFFNSAKFYSKFCAKINLKNGEEVLLKDDFRYKFDENKAKEITRFLLENGYGNPPALKFYNLLKSKNINPENPCVFSQKEGNKYFVGLISEDKNEFKSIKRQVLLQYYDFKQLIENKPDLFIVEDEKENYIRVDVVDRGYLIELLNVDSKPDIILNKDVK